MYLRDPGTRGTTCPVRENLFVDEIKNSPLRQPCPHRARGRIAMSRYYLNRKFLDDCVQEIRHNRKWGMPQRRGHACMPKRASELFSRNFLFFYAEVLKHHRMWGVRLFPEQKYPSPVISRQTAELVQGPQPWPGPARIVPSEFCVTGFLSSAGPVRVRVLSDWQTR
jgi:hypothetical protein